MRVVDQEKADREQSRKDGDETLVKRSAGGHEGPGKVKDEDHDYHQKTAST